MKLLVFVVIALVVALVVFSSCRAARENLREECSHDMDCQGDGSFSLVCVNGRCMNPFLNMRPSTRKPLKDPMKMLPDCLRVQGRRCQSIPGVCQC